MFHNNRSTDWHRLVIFPAQSLAIRKQNLTYSSLLHHNHWMVLRTYFSHQIIKSSVFSMMPTFWNTKNTVVALLRTVATMYWVPSVCHSLCHRFYMCYLISPLKQNSQKRSVQVGHPARKQQNLNMNSRTSNTHCVFANSASTPASPGSTRTA